MAVHCAPEPEKGGEEGREKGEGRRRRHQSTTEAAGAGDDATIGYSSAALLPELHSLELPLHHHPISHDTNGEPVLPYSPPDHAALAMALHTGST